MMFFWNKKKRAAQDDNDPYEGTDAPKDIVENLYKKNIETLNKNKTLSLLSKLYEIGILALEPPDLAARICQTVQTDLNFEVVSVFLFDQKTNALSTLAYSGSSRLQKSMNKKKLSFDNLRVQDAKSNKFFKQSLSVKRETITNEFAEIWRNTFDIHDMEDVAVESHIRTAFIHPLIIEGNVLGVILLALNRGNGDLSSFEKDSIKSFTNVISLSLEKAFLYKKLQSANEELRELDRQKDELLSIVSHQLATPVSSFKWYIEMMLDGDMGDITDEYRKHLTTMQSVAVNLSDLVGMILDVSRIQLGRMRLEPQKLDLDQFFAEILSVIEPKAQEKGVKLTKSIPTELPTVLLDKRLTRMTMENLLSNAVKYTPKDGSVSFTVEVFDHMMRCIVKDTGCGIPKSDHSKIFGKLFRASNVRNEVDGNGFGLYIAKGAIEGQNGKIWFESEGIEGKGTTFYIELPLVSPEDKE